MIPTPPEKEGPPAIQGEIPGDQGGLLPEGKKALGLSNGVLILFSIGLALMMLGISFFWEPIRWTWKPTPFVSRPEEDAAVKDLITTTIQGVEEMQRADPSKGSTGPIPPAPPMTDGGSPPKVDYSKIRKQ